MSKLSKFPANSILEWYDEAESMLEEFLKYIPYCDEHKEVWSPKLVGILQETCSQLDSLWRWEAAHEHQRRQNEVDMTDYFELFGSDVTQRWILFWADEPEKIKPFDAWGKVSRFVKSEYQNYPLDWWKEGYQKIKHNRVENFRCASLSRSVEALAALFLAIIHSENCWPSLWEKHWLSCWSGMPFEPLDCLREDFGLLQNENRCGVMHMVVETRLFTYPVGLCSGLFSPGKYHPDWSGDCSRRFKKWYSDLCENP